MSERRGSMYDPARDLFTASDEAALPDTPNAIQASESPPATNKRPRDSASTSPLKEDSPSKKPFHKDESSPPSKKLKSSPPPANSSALQASKPDDAPKPITAASLSSISAVRAKKPVDAQNDTASRSRRGPTTYKRRSISPANDSGGRRRHEYRREDRRERRRSPAAHTQRRSRSPLPIPRSPTPPPRSPPRERKRPGGGARVSTADREAVRQRQLEREQNLTSEARAAAAARGVHDVVKQHYNAVPQRGREWRKTDSKIKGLRSLNNWVKSAIIQKFSPGEDFVPGAGAGQRGQGLAVLDIGCGKGGDLQKWQAAPQKVGLYVGIDAADVSIDQARDRYAQMSRGGGFRHRGPPFQAEFIVKDCFGDWIGDVPIIQEVGIDPSVGPGGGGSQRWNGGGFDVVTMMFCMHYAFENEAKARCMLRNAAGCLKKGGRFIGVIPNSDVLAGKVKEFYAKRGKPVDDEAAKSGDNGEDDDDDDWDPEKPSAPAQSAEPKESNEQLNGASQDQNGNASATASAPDETPEWGNSIYRVKFPTQPAPPVDGVFRPPYGWKYFYFMEEAVEEIPEYVVPWEAFRAIAEDYNLELQYRKPFGEVWEDEKDDPVLGPLSRRMGVRDRDTGAVLVREEEFEAAGFYHAFCFYKI